MLTGKKMAKPLTYLAQLGDYLDYIGLNRLNKTLKQHDAMKFNVKGKQLVSFEMDAKKILKEMGVRTREFDKMKDHFHLLDKQSKAYSEREMLIKKHNIKENNPRMYADFQAGKRFIERAFVDFPKRKINY